VSTYLLTLVGKYLCYAILALAVDLIWGYCGILSLGHAAFFSLGGYAMGMYLMRQIGKRGVYGDPILPDFMVFLNWHHCRGSGTASIHFSFALLMMVLVPALLALVFGWLAFRSRVTGVYLSIMTQALSYALMLASFRNDMGFGGNNGFTDFKELLGYDLTRTAHASSCLSSPRSRSAQATSACRAITAFARRPRGSRDPGRREPHPLPRVPRSSRTNCGCSFFPPSSPALRARFTFRRSDHQPERVSRRSTRLRSSSGSRSGTRHTRRRGGGRRPRAIMRRRSSPARCLKSGSMRSARSSCWSIVSASRPDGPRAAVERRPMIEIPPPELLRGTILDLKDLTVSFDGFKALDALSLQVDAGGVALHHRSEWRRQNHDDGRGDGKTRPDRGSAFFGKIDLLDLSEPEIAQAGIGRNFRSRRSSNGSVCSRTSSCPCGATSDS